MKKIIEKIFKRKEMTALRNLVFNQAEQIRQLTTGETMHLDQHERRMILRALKTSSFKAIIEAPETKAYVRIAFRGLQEKLKQSIKAENDETRGTGD